MTRRTHCDRRAFFGVLSGAALSASWALADGTLPTVRDPRATDADDRFEPQWEQALTITVGPQDADLVGKNDRVLQAAVDYVARYGGGTVEILPGTYTLRNAVHLPSRIRILGHGADSVITKIPSRTVPLAADSDWYDREITLQEAEGFRIGDGVLLRAKNPHNGGATVIKQTLTAQAGRRFKLSQGLRENLWLEGQPTCSSLFPLLTSDRTSDVVIENITLDGNSQNNENLNGNYGGCIFLQNCQRYTIRKVIARNFNGDGISFQTSHDVVVDSCECLDNADLGLHPGSGSQRPLLRHNRLERNTIGLFWCWGVKFGLAEYNQIRGNRNYGMSIGHNDTDNLIRHNEIAESGKVGILFRDDNRGADFWANRNTIENNRILNSGAADGVGIDLHGKTHDVVIRQNEFSESRGAMQRVGVRLGSDTRAITLSENRFQGLAYSVVDRRPVRS